MLDWLRGLLGPREQAPDPEGLLLERIRATMAGERWPGHGDLRQFARAYRMLAEEDYRPAAPSDGMGTITVPVEQLDLDAEAQQYALGIAAQDQERVWWCGCMDVRLAPAALLALEAFRLMNAGSLWDEDHPSADDPGRLLVPRLLRRAAEEYERVARGEGG